MPVNCLHLVLPAPNLTSVGHHPTEHGEKQTTAVPRPTQCFRWTLQVWANDRTACAISGFRLEGDETCTLLVAFLDFLTLEDDTDRLSRNVGEELPLLAAYYLRRTQISCDMTASHIITEQLLLHCNIPRTAKRYILAAVNYGHNKIHSSRGEVSAMTNERALMSQPMKKTIINKPYFSQLHCSFLILCRGKIEYKL
jgi:hypothetical protein